MKKKFVAMIPCRLGSQRVPKKNLRLIAGRTLSQWVASACREAEVFDEIYINSEAPVFEKIAASCGAKFYRRPAALASNSATNDDFALDFMESVPCDVLIQVNPTSPFTDKEDIRMIVKMFEEENYQTVHTVKDEQIEALFQGRPLNFDPLKQMPPSQDLVPVKVFTSSIMGWDTRKFRENMAKRGCAVYGGDGKIGYYTVKGLGTLDIDREFDFQLAEMIAGVGKKEPAYYEA